MTLHGSYLKDEKFKLMIGHLLFLLLT